MGKKSFVVLLLILLEILIIILISAVIKLIFIPTAILHTQEAIQDNNTGNINYIITSDLSSKGAFVVNNKVDVTINITSVYGRDFDGATAEISICLVGDDCYLFPIHKNNGVWTSSFIPSAPFSYYNISKDNKVITGKIQMIFSLSGEYPLFFIHIIYPDGFEYSWLSSKKIIVEPQSVLFQLEGYQWSLIALIVTILTTIIIEISNNLGRKENPISPSSHQQQSELLRRAM